MTRTQKVQALGVLALCLGVVVLSLVYSLDTNTDVRFAWRMFSGSRPTCSVVLQPWDKNEKPGVPTVLTDTLETGRRYLAGFQPLYCAHIAKQNFARVAVSVCPKPPAYLAALQNQKSFCPTHP